jgi:hypothetical protein
MARPHSVGMYHSVIPSWCCHTMTLATWHVMTMTHRTRVLILIMYVIALVRGLQSDVDERNAYKLLTELRTLDPAYKGIVCPHVVFAHRCAQQLASRSDVTVRTLWE